MPCRGSRMSCAAPTCSTTRPGRLHCSEPCSCPLRAMRTCRWSPSRAAASLQNQGAPWRWIRGWPGRSCTARSPSSARTRPLRSSPSHRLTSLSGRSPTGVWTESMVCGKCRRRRVPEGLNGSVCPSQSWWGCNMVNATPCTREGAQQQSHSEGPAMSDPRTIKKYPNRRLYDTVESRYITLADIRRLVIDRVDFVVIDKKTQSDITRSILLQVIAEQEHVGEPLMSRDFLSQVIRSYGDSMRSMVGSYLEQSLKLFANENGGRPPPA